MEHNEAYIPNSQTQSYWVCDHVPSQGSGHVAPRYWGTIQVCRWPWVQGALAWLKWGFQQFSQWCSPCQGLCNYPFGILQWYWDISLPFAMWTQIGVPQLWCHFQCQFQSFRGTMGGTTIVKQESGETLRDINRNLMRSQAGVQVRKEGAWVIWVGYRVIYIKARRGAASSSADVLGVFPSGGGEKGARRGTCWLDLWKYNS